MVFRSWKMSGMMNGSTSSSRMAEISKTMRKNSSRDMRKNDITDVYLRLLTSGERNPPREDWPAALELIDQGLATAKVHPSSETAAGEVDMLALFQPTPKGQRYARSLVAGSRGLSLRLAWKLVAGALTLLATLATIAGFVLGL